MIKKNLKTIIIASVASLLPIIAGLFLWDKLPDTLPIHWNASGEVDGWCSKPFAVLFLPIIMFALEWLIAFLTSADPKKANHSEKMLALTFWLVPAISLAISAIIYLTALGTEVSINIVTSLVFGFTFIILGNYMPKCKQNYTIGFKIAWTLNSEENWNKTHRVAGWTMVIGGILIAFVGCLDSVLFTLPIITLMVAIPLVYSYVLHRKGI